MHLACLLLQTLSVSVKCHFWKTISILRRRVQFSFELNFAQNDLEKDILENVHDFSTIGSTKCKKSFVDIFSLETTLWTNLCHAASCFQKANQGVHKPTALWTH